MEQRVYSAYLFMVDGLEGPRVHSFLDQVWL
jgi:hypothetical protein